MSPPDLSTNDCLRERVALAGVGARQPQREFVTLLTAPRQTRHFKSKRSGSMRYLIATVIFTALGISPALATSRPVPFVVTFVKNPQPTQEIFAHSWPNLIKENNDFNINGFLHRKPVKGRNFGLYIDIATVPINGATAIISINDTPFAKCNPNPLGENHHDLPVAILCPARLTIKRNGNYKTYNIGKICRVGSNNPHDLAYAEYSEKQNKISAYAMIGGKKVVPSDFDENCDKTIKLER